MSDKEFLVTCSVCVCNYDGESRKQKFLPCLHSFCQSCLTQVKQFDRIKCPICRCEVRLLSGDVSTLPDTYFECLREMEKKMKKIQLKGKEKTRRIEEMKRKIDQQGRKINQLRWSNNRLAADCDELKRFKQYMETVFVAKDKQICSLNEIVNTAKKLEEAQNQKRPDEAQAARTEDREDLYFPDPEDILQHRDDEDEENELRDLEERFSNQNLKDHEEIDELINQELRDHQDDFEELTNQELRDHQEYMEELTNHEFKDMYEFGEDFCDSMF